MYTSLINNFLYYFSFRKFLYAFNISHAIVVIAVCSIVWCKWHLITLYNELSINQSFYSSSYTFSIIHNKFTIKNSGKMKRMLFSLLVTYPGWLNSNYRVINNTILQRNWKKNTSKFNKKKQIFVCTIFYTIISIAQWEQCARKIISNVFTNNYII